MFCASQNTMAALINGSTLHSYFTIAFKGKDGKCMNIQKDDKTDMSKEYIRYQALRFVFIDEFSTASRSILAEINHKTSTYIRQNNTWSKRKTDEDTCEFRPFGGLNLVVSGDAWQFTPVRATAVFDNPTRVECQAGQRTIASMFSLSIREPRSTRPNPFFHP